MPTSWANRPNVRADGPNAGPVPMAAATRRLISVDGRRYGRGRPDRRERGRSALDAES
jgi:hypothetical protein